MLYSPSKLLDDQTIPKPTSAILRSDENFLYYFYRKLIDTYDLSTIEDALSEWI